MAYDPMNEDLLDTKAVCSRLAISRRSLRRLVRSGELAAFRIAGSYRFSPADLQSYLSANRIDAQPRAFLKAKR